MKSELIGARLALWRKSLDLTQEKFAEKINMQIGVYRKYEQGKNIPGGEALASIAATGVNINWLLTGEGQMKKMPESDQEPLSLAELAEFQKEFQHIFDMLLLIEGNKRAPAINDIVSRVKEAARISELERQLKELQDK